MMEEQIEGGFCVIPGLAPAKINLTLDILPPRGDGFHDLDSLVAKFTPADKFFFHVAWSTGASLEMVTLSCSNPTLPCDESNLVIRALRAFVERFSPDTVEGVLIDLEKNLPMQAGLGGGSSDAATVLRELNRWYAVPADELREVAAAIGSDVPLFLENAQAVRMQGRGERVKPLPDDLLPPLYGVIVRPDVGVATGPAYAALDALPNRTPGNATARFWEALKKKELSDAADVAPLLHNDFEAAILPAYSPVAEAHRALTKSGALRALLCGSGSAVFGLARDKVHAQAIAAELEGRFPFVAVAEPFNGRYYG